MYAEKCPFRSKEIPACNTEKDLRKCDSIICCSICPRVDYCEHVCGSVLLEQQKDIYDIVTALKIVEIELFSFCNRTCGWCPNGNGFDRLNACYFLDEHLLRKLLEELQENDYNGVFSFSRYNEPFAYFNYFQKNLKIIKEYFPYSKLVTNTNGDYLDTNIIKETLIDELSIMDYDCQGKEWCYSRLIEWNVSDIVEYESYFVGRYDNKTILYYWDWPKTGNISDRGGNLSQYSCIKRSYPCFEPFRFLGVNYDGTLSPCCNIRNDSKKQQDFIIGDLKTDNLATILLSEKFNAFKQKIILGQYDLTMPCYYCNNIGGRYSTSTGGILYE